MDTNSLIDLRRGFETFRRPMGFNYVHFLLIHLYNSGSSSTIIKTYPLYSTFSRIQHKLNLPVSEEEDHQQQSIIEAIVHFVSQNNDCLTETVEQTHLSINLYPVSCLFRLYSPMHLILFMEPLIVLNDQRLNNIIRTRFVNEYPKEKCDYVHFCIAHRKTELVKNILSENGQQTDHWLTTKINSPSDRSWLPIHYAAYIADRILIEKLCTQYSQLMNPFHFILPKSRMRDFSENPFDYLLRASGMKMNVTNPPNTTLTLDEDDDDAPILPLMNDAEDDDDLASPLSPFVVEDNRDERRNSVTIEQEALQAVDADIPDADQLELSTQFSRDSILRCLIEQAKGSVYFIPSPLLLASACPLIDDQYKQSYIDIIQLLLDSKLVDIDGLNHYSLTKNTLDYFSRHKYSNFTWTKSIPYIYYQCDALFTSSIKENLNRISQFSDDEPTISKLVYFITILNQHSLFSRYEYFDQQLLRQLLELHSHQIEHAFGYQINLNQYIKGKVLEQEQINDLTFRVLIRYRMQHNHDQIEIDINFYFIDSYIDQFADTYITLFHTPIIMAIQNSSLDIVEILLANISPNKNTNWGSLANYELETCVDQLFSRRGKITSEKFTKFCLAISNIRTDESIIQQRIFVHALATCIKYNAKAELEHLICNYAQIYYDSCIKYPTDIRHNILAYCVVRNQALVLETLISAFSSLNYDNYQLYMLPLSNLSSVSEDYLSTVLNKYKTNGISTSGKSIFTCSGNEYGQCRRIRNTAIAYQQKRNPIENSSRQDLLNSTNEPPNNRLHPTILNFWRTVRFSIRRRKQDQYTRQINSPDSDDQTSTTTTPVVGSRTTDANKNIYERASIEIPEPVLNELPITVPIVPRPMLISMTSTDQEDEPDVTPVTGQTLLHIAAKLPDHEDVIRVLLGENANMTSLVNSNGQIPLLCAVQAGSTLSAQLLMDADPHSLVTTDNKKSSIFHYCCEKKNDVLLASILHILQRSSLTQSVGVQALQNLITQNTDGQTPFSIACHYGSIKCLKQLLNCKWLLNRVNLANLITSDGIKRCIDNDQLDIIIYLVSDLQRFRVIISILIDVVFTEPLRPSADVVVGRRHYNVLEYAILLKKADFVKIFVNVTVPKMIEMKPNIEEHRAVVRSSNVVTHETSLYDEYKRFLTRYSLPFKNEEFDQTPIQRMLKVPSLVPFVPNLLDQFLDGDGMDLSVIDDCLCSKPRPARCIFGQNSSRSTIPNNPNKTEKFTTNQWIKEHPLNLISECDYAPIYDHSIVTMTVDSKADLFGNLLYLCILLIQAMYVALYTGVTIVTRTPKYYGYNYVDFENETCVGMCNILTNSTEHIEYKYNGTLILYIFRFLLLACSCLALLKEFVQIVTQRGRYFRAFFLNLLEILTYSCGIIFAMDIHSCSKYSSIRCKFQYDFGALGIASVWTVLLLVVVNSLKLGKYGLLFITVFLTFLKFCFIYAFIWIGYLFAFHMLLTQNPAFDTILGSIPRMIAMLTGEFNFENLFFTHKEPVRGTTMAKVIFTAFVFVVHICVMNILIGLAVSDVNDFQINAKRENLRSRIRTVLNFQAKFGSVCRASSRLMFLLARSFPELLTGLKFDVSKLSLRAKPVQVPNRASYYIQCRVGHVTIKQSDENLTHAQQKQVVQDTHNENILNKVNEIHEEIQRTQLKFTQELHRLTINLSKMGEK